MIKYKRNKKTLSPLGWKHGNILPSCWKNGNIILFVFSWQGFMRPYSWKQGIRGYRFYKRNNWS